MLFITQFVDCSGRHYHPLPFTFKEELSSSSIEYLQMPLETNIWRIKILQKHYKYWYLKWGFDPLNPTINDIYQRYWNTALCCKINPSFYQKNKNFCDLLASEIFNA